MFVLHLQGTELNDDRTPSDATVTTTFNILVIDINDNAPEFNSSEYSVAITELAQVGFALPLFIQVVDRDEVSPWNYGPSRPTTLPGRVTWYLCATAPPLPYLRINKAAKISGL